MEKCPKKIEVDDDEDYIPGNEKYVRFICISDTHTYHNNLKLPEGDVLIHTGDFTMRGTESEVQSFSKWLGSLKYKHKVVVSGNHELTFDLKNEAQIRMNFGLK